MTTSASMTAAQAKELFARQGEFAVLDVREQEEFSRGHMLLASCAPLSRLELLVQDLVPCMQTPVLLVDSGQETGPSRAGRARDVLLALGYANPRVLEGGMLAWRQAGFIEFTGVGALSKGFGEYVEEKLHTPRYEPAAIKTLMDSGEKFAVIDVRPREEYANMNIPTGMNAPGCEVLYRFADLAPDPQATVVVNCAGRTRSIIGTQTLRNAGVPNKVVALKGGTMNWQLAGFNLEYGTPRRTAPPSARALDFARERSAMVAERCKIAFVDAATLGGWQRQETAQTLYVFDVRQPEEFEAGHLPGSRNAPGGQLVQATDEYAAVRNGRYVLVDDTEVRAVMTAHWLKQLGLPEVYVLRGGLGGSGLGGLGLERGPAAPRVPKAPDIPGVTALELKALREGPTPPLVINVGVSRVHRQGHIPGAAWVTRGYLERAVAAYPDAKHIVVTSDSCLHAALAARDATALWPGAEVLRFRGGTPAWAKAELPLAEGMPLALCAEDDIWYKPYTDVNAKPEAMMGYFDWEFGLVENIMKDGDAHFALIDLHNG